MTRPKLILIAKLVVGVAVVVVILSQVTFRDEVGLAGGGRLSGTLLPGDGTDAILLRDAGGHVHRLDPRDVARHAADSARADVVPGLLTIYRRISPGRYALALGAMLAMYLIGVWRWALLLRAQQITLSFGDAFRLTFIGFFFNNVVPGLTGGDLVKMIYAAQRCPGRRTEAVATVIVDRVVGLVVLALLSAIVILWNLDRYSEVGTYVFGFLGAAAAGLVLFFSRRVRSALRIDRLVRRLPVAGLLGRLDQAFFLYRAAWRSVAVAAAVSVVAHALNILSIAIMGNDVGLHISAAQYAATVPIILIVSSLPLLPGGWGIGEAAYWFFFSMIGVADLNLTVGLSILTRTSALLLSLLGGVFLVAERRRPPAAVPADAALHP